MKKKERKMIGVIILIGLLVIGIIFFAVRGKKDSELPQQAGIVENKVGEEFVKVLDDGTKVNTSNKLSIPKKIEGLDVGNIQLTDKNGVSVVLADVVNNTSSKSQLMKVTLTLLDKSGNKIVDMNGIIPALDPGEKTQLNMGAGSGYANAYDFNIVKK